MASEFITAKRILDRWTSADIFPAVSLLVQKNGEIVLEYASGWSDSDQKIPTSVENIWVAASLAKPLQPQR